MIVFIIVLVIIGIAVLSSFASGSDNEHLSNVDSGKKGEYMVRNVLKGNIEGKQYVINDITIKDGSGYTSQIDHIVINKSGIHVIETKNWSGKVVGDYDDSTWVEYFDSGAKFNMYNPIRQNETHIRRLQNLIGDRVPMYNVVCFTNENVRIKTNGTVCLIGNLKDRINRQGYMSEKDIIKTYERIRSLAV